MSDQDTTAPGQTITRAAPLGVGLTFLLDYSLPCEQWMTNLWFNIREAALEEMRVRAALARAGMDENGRVRIRPTFNGPGPKTCPYDAHHQPCDCDGKGGDR